MSNMNKRERVLNAPDKEVGQATGILAKLWRGIMGQYAMDEERYDRLMEMWLNNPRNGIPNDAKKRSSARGTLSKELFRDDMTWRVFLKAIRFISPLAVRIQVTVEWPFGRETTTEYRVRVKDINLDLEGYDLPPNDEDKP